MAPFRKYLRHSYWTQRKDQETRAGEQRTRTPEVGWREAHQEDRVNTPRSFELLIEVGERECIIIIIITTNRGKLKGGA